MVDNSSKGGKISALFDRFFTKPKVLPPHGSTNMRAPPYTAPAGKRSETTVNRPAKKRIAAGLLGKDYEEIEGALLGPRAWEDSRRLATMHPLAPPQGSPWLYERVLTVKQTLRRFSPLFWK